MHFCFPIFDQPSTVATDALDSKVGTWHHTRYRIHGIDQQTFRVKSGTPDVTTMQPLLLNFTLYCLSSAHECQHILS
jgi:hypothetical protein